MHPEDLIAAWHAWDACPGGAAAAAALNDAVHDYAGAEANDLYRHVAAQRHQGLSISAAIYTWSPTWT